MGKVLGTYLRGLRVENQLSVRTLSASVGVAKSYMDYIEAGMREPRADVLARLAVVLKASLSELLDKQRQDLLCVSIVNLSEDLSKDMVFSDDIDGYTNVCIRARDLAQNLLIGIERASSESSRVASFVAVTEDGISLKETTKACEGVISSEDFCEDLQAIIRLCNTMPKEDLQKLRGVLEWFAL